MPLRRAVRFGLPEHCHVGLLARVAPFLAWQRAFPKLFPDLRERLIIRALERAVIDRLEPCDVFICLSGVYLEAAQYARRRFGARIFLERGSRHILSQREILAAIGRVKGPSQFFVDRELAGYALADRIVVPSGHVAESFQRDPSAAVKLFRNPYGVDLAHFPQRADGSQATSSTLLFVGAWSYRKGADLLTKAVEQIPAANLLHIGDIDDLPFPNHPRFRHVDSVTQLELADYYSRAPVFVLASREEGLAMVQAQALASGLILVCTDRTGGVDLGHSPELRRRIYVVPSEDLDALKRGIGAALEAVHSRPGLDPLPEEDRQRLSWLEYGRRYSNELMRAS